MERTGDVNKGASIDLPAEEVAVTKVESARPGKAARNVMAESSVVSNSDEISRLMLKIKQQEEEIERLRRSGDEEPSEPGVANVSQASSKERFAVIIEEAQTENELPEVHVGVNGRVYQMKRGVVVEVPREVVGVLRDAVVQKLVPTTVEIGGLQFVTGHTVRSSRRFPFRVLGKVIDEHGNRIAKYEAEQSPEAL